MGGAWSSLRKRLQIKICVLDMALEGNSVSVPPSLRGLLNTGAHSHACVSVASLFLCQLYFSFLSHSALPDFFFFFFNDREHELEPPHLGIKFLSTTCDGHLDFTCLPLPSSNALHHHHYLPGRSPSLLHPLRC